MLRGLQRKLFSPYLIVAFGEMLFPFFGKRRKPVVDDSPKVILVVRLDDLGDQVLNSCFLREIRKSHPDSRILLLTKSPMLPLLMNCPYVDETVGVDISEPKGPFGPLVLFYRLLALSARHYWSINIDWVINPRRHPDYYYANLMAYLSGGKIRWGYQNGISDHFLNRVLVANTKIHEVEHNLETIRCLGGRISDHTIEIWVSQDDRDAAWKVMLSAGLGTSDEFVVFGVGAAAPARRWPPVRFAELAQKLIAHMGLKVVVVGGPHDRDMAQIIAGRNPQMVIDMAGRLSLPQTAALMSHGALFVGNDSGPMHLASAAGIPVVEISMFPVHGPSGHANSPSQFGPWGVPFALVQPQQDWNIEAISVEDVLDAASSLLKISHGRLERVCP